MTGANAEQRAAIFDGLRAHHDAAKAEAIIASIEERYDVEELDWMHLLNASLRESWRFDHGGSTEEWDRTAAATGNMPPERSKV